MANKIPKHWIKIKLEDVSTPSQYGWTTKSTSKGEYKYLRTTDISSSAIDWDRVPFCLEVPEYPENYLLKENDILISRAGSIGLNYLVKNIPFETLFASYLIRFRPLCVDPSYIYYFLKSSEYWSYISQSAAGIAVQNVNAQKLSQLPIPLAPLKEQTKIAKALNSFFERYFEVQSKLESIPALITEFRQQVLHMAVTGELTKDWRRKKGVIAKWETEILGNLTSKIGSGSTPRGGKAAYNKIGIPFIRSMNVHTNNFKYDGLAYLNNSQAEELRNVVVERKDVLLNITGASIGRVCIVPDELVGARVNQHVCIIRPKESLNSMYLQIFLASPDTQKYIENNNYGATRQALTKQMIENFIISKPQLNEQNEIVRMVKRLFTIVDKIELNYYKTKEMLDQLPQAILEKAYSGKLVPPVKGDEPVEKLLEKIKEEKDSLEQENKRNKANRIIRPKVKIMEILELLEKKGKMKAVDVWKYSNYMDDIEKFYAQLKILVEKEKKVIETKKGKESYLELANENR